MLCLISKKAKKRRGRRVGEKKVNQSPKQKERKRLAQ